MPPPANVTITGVRSLSTATARTGNPALLTAYVGPLTSSAGVSVGGARGDTAATGGAGLTGMFSAWVGPGVNQPFVIGATAQATATAQAGTPLLNNVSTVHVTVVGERAAAAASGRVGTLSTAVTAAASLVVEIDFVGNPTAPYFDQVSQQTSTVSYWRMNDTVTLTDEVGSNNGVITGSPTLITGALAYDTDQALRFNGTTQYVQVPSSATLTQSGSYSAAGWLRLPSLPSALKVVFSKGSYRLEVTADNKLQFSVTNDQDGTLTNTAVVTNTVLMANTWYHVICVHDGTADQLKVYLNGVLDNTAAHSVGTEINATQLQFAGVRNATAPAFRAASGTGNPSGSNQSTFVISVPTVVSGDFMFAQLWNTQIGTLTAPAGWTLLSSLDVGTVGQQRVYYRFAGASEPASYTWTFSLSTSWGGAISTWSGVDSTYPFAKPVYVFADAATATTHSTRSHLIDAYNTLAVAFMSGAASAQNSVVSSWSSGTERYDFTGTSFPYQGVAAASQVPAYGTSLSVTATGGNSQRLGIGLVVLNGTGVGSFTAADLDEWAFLTSAITDEDAAEMYDARLSGVAAWTDVSTDVRNASASYGRQYELNRMESGRAGITLKNQHRRYDPANTSSTYYPNVKPNRKIRMRALLSGVYYPLWEGLIERWPSDWGISWNYDEVKLTVADGFKALNRAGISTLIGSGVSGTQINTALTRALWPVDKRAIDTGEFIMTAETTDTITSALGVIQDIAESELGQFFINHIVDGSPATFHDRAHRWSNSRSLTSQVTFTDQPGTGIRYNDLVPSDDDDNVVNEWIVTSANGTTGTAIDTVSRQENYPVTGERTTKLDNPDDAIMQARALLQQTARPALRFDQLTVRLTTQTAASTWRSMLQLAISDRVTVIRNPVPGAGGSTITKICFIEGISWEITPSYWDVSFQLSPISSLPFYDTVLILDPVSYWRMDENS